MQKHIYEARFWRANPQLANGGYETVRTYEATCKRAAVMKARQTVRNRCYGGMTLLGIERIDYIECDDNQGGTK